MIPEAAGSRLATDTGCVRGVNRHCAETLRRQGTRKWTPASGQPFVLLIVDQLADVRAYQPDNGLRKRANLALQTPGVAWAKIDGRRDPDRTRAFHTTDADLDELSAYVTAGRHHAPRTLTEIEAA